MATPNYYAILEIPEFSDISRVKSAYRALAQKHHPDTSDSEDSKNIIQQVNEAYEVLGDKTNKKKWPRSSFRHGPA